MSDFPEQAADEPHLQFPEVQVSVEPEQITPAPHLQTPESPRIYLINLIITCIANNWASIICSAFANSSSALKGESF